jgi:hypothetical protein
VQSTASWYFVWPSRMALLQARASFADVKSLKG